MLHNQPKTATTTIENKQTITFTKKGAGTEKLMGWTKTTSRKKTLQKKENRQIKEWKRTRDKIVDAWVMALQRGIDEGDSGTESTGIPTTHDSNEEATSAAEAQQLADNLHQYEYEF